MKAKDEDSALNTLAAAWLVLHDGSEDHVEDCYFSLQELCDQFGQTATLLTLMGACKMLLGIGAMSDGRSSVSRLPPESSPFPAHVNVKEVHPTAQKLFSGLVLA